MELLHTAHNSTLHHLPLRILPSRRLVQMQPPVRDVAGGAGGCAVILSSKFSVAVGEFANEGGVGVVEDVESRGSHGGCDQSGGSDGGRKRQRGDRGG